MVMVWVSDSTSVAKTVVEPFKLTPPDEDEELEDVRGCITFVVEADPFAKNGRLGRVLSVVNSLGNIGKLGGDAGDASLDDVEGIIPLSRRSLSSCCSRSVASTMRRKPSVSVKSLLKFVFNARRERMKSKGGVELARFY